jgi:hypothetical protein
MGLVLGRGTNAFLWTTIPPQDGLALGKRMGCKNVALLPFEGVSFHRAAGLTRWQKMHKRDRVCELSNSEPKPELLEGKRDGQGLEERHRAQVQVQSLDSIARLHVRVPSRKERSRGSTLVHMHAARTSEARLPRQLRHCGGCKVRAHKLIN